jgi:membrane dipeptidase
MIKDSDGMVGLNFAVAFLRPDGQMQSDTGLDVMMRHLDHLITHLSEDRVGLGSDFDGAEMPDAIGDIAGLSNFRNAMRRHGINDALMAKLCSDNWLAVLGRTWK